MTLEIKKYRNEIQELKIKKTLLKEDILSLHESIEEFEKEQKVYLESKEILSIVSKATQLNFAEYIQSLVTVALKAVYGDDIEFVVEIKDDGWYLMVKEIGGVEAYFPKDEEGSGVLDIISLALRVVMWSIQKPLSRNFMYLDEPMKAIGNGVLLENAISMIKDINKKLGIQFLINTHVEEIAALGDKTFYVDKKNGISKVYSEGGEKEEKQIRGKRLKRG